MAMSPGEKIAQSNPQMDMPEDETVANPKANVSNDMNPVLDAFRTIATFIAAKQQQGDPNAGEMQALLAQFVSLLQGKTGPASGEQGMMGPPAEMPMKGRIGMGKAVNPSGAGKGRVQVI